MKVQKSYIVNTMSVKCGVDIVYIPSLARMIGHDITLKKFFHASEVGDSSLEHLAGILAAKEAFFKALGLRPKFLDITVGHENTGRPKLLLAPQWQNYKTCDVSISHDQDYAMAMVVLELAS